jgi:hypothetical protein
MVTNLPFPRISSSPALPKKVETTPAVKKPVTNKPPISISAAAAQSSRTEPKNPFDEDDEGYDNDEDKSNPFLEPSEPKNPFEEDDYDSSLNPFAE